MIVLLQVFRKFMIYSRVIFIVSQIQTTLFKGISGRSVEIRLLMMIEKVKKLVKTGNISSFLLEPGLDRLIFVKSNFHMAYI